MNIYYSGGRSGVTFTYEIAPGVVECEGREYRVNLASPPDWYVARTREGAVVLVPQGEGLAARLSTGELATLRHGEPVLDGDSVLMGWGEVNRALRVWGKRCARPGEISAVRAP